MRNSRRSFTPLEGLGKALEEKRRNSPSSAPLKLLRKRLPAASVFPEDTETAEQLFLEAMADVREITEFRKLSCKEPSQTSPVVPDSPPDRTMEELRNLVRGKRGITLSDTDEYIEWVRKGVRPQIIKRLRSGEISVQDCLDLHGFTVAEAEEEFYSFISEAKRRGLCCVKVIHGRGLRSPGGPVLKEAVQSWLKRHSLAYATARRVDGGLGATYVLLRR